MTNSLESQFQSRMSGISQYTSLYVPVFTGTHKNGVFIVLISICPVAPKEAMPKQCRLPSDSWVFYTQISMHHNLALRVSGYP